MDYNVIYQPNKSPPLSLPKGNGNNTTIEPKTILPNKCSNRKDNNMSCNTEAPCSHCTSIGGSNIRRNNTLVDYKTDKQFSAIKAPRRGYKSHVPSACVNCKTAHLACDVSRPCKRCISLKKEDTCQDMQHKKRGRPKLREKRVYPLNEHSYEILYGTIQEPAIMMKNTSRNIIPNQQAPPFKTKVSHYTKRPSLISFVHESFQSQNDSPTKSIATTSSPNSLDSSHHTDLTIDTMAGIPTLQLTSNLLTSQPLFFNNQDNSPCAYYSHISHPSPSLPTTSSHQQTPDFLTIILSMEVCCAKVSDDTIKCWGYYPQELAHRSLYDFISPKDSDRLARLHRLLIDNAMIAIKSNQTDPATFLPPTERTISSLFSNTAQQQLSAIANGSRSFSDTIHIKKRTGEYELYKVIVYIGGGLGADLYDASTLSKQYIVAQFKRHEYEVIVPSPLPPSSSAVAAASLVSATSIANTLLSTDDFTSHYNNYNNNSNIQPIAVFSPMLPLTPTSPSNSSSLNFGNSIHRNSSTSLDLFNHQPSNRKPSLMHPSLSPKFNIAPTTNTSNSLFHCFQPTSSSSQASSSKTPVHMQSSSMTVTHPTQQYFLQTSSSTLNAAASAAQNKSRSNVLSQETTVVTSDKKIEMSIPSLLC